MIVGEESSGDHLMVMVMVLRACVCTNLTLFARTIMAKVDSGLKNGCGKHGKATFRILRGRFMPTCKFTATVCYSNWI